MTDTATGQSRARVLIGWALRIVMAVAIAPAGVLKIAGAQVMVDLFAAVGVGQWLRYVTGALEIAGAVGLLIPLLSGLAAAGLVALLAGATITNIFVVNQSPIAPLAMLTLCAVIAWLQRSTIRDLRTAVWPPTVR
jgi:uncharacterized membrane protein